MRLRALDVVLPLALLLAGCAARGPIVPPYVADLGRAEALLGQGCYTCLQESLALFEKIRTIKSAPAYVPERAFDAALLIAIREKELGIPSESMALARRMVLPSRQAVLDAAELIVGDATGLDPDMRAQQNGGRNRLGLEPANAVRRALDGMPETDLAAKYVALSIDCEQPKLIESVDMRAMTSIYAGVPLIRFRLSTCGRPAAPNVGALREVDPKWTDSLYWEGRRELTASRTTAIDFPKALGFFAEGRKAFSQSLMLAMATGNTSMAAEEFESALASFDDVLAKYPTHRDALSGRMQSLSYLMRHTDAVAAATRLLELGTWHIADANYWRAWNRYHLKEYEPAWVDVENATRGLSNARVYMLAGLIAYSRKEVPTAIQRFDTAFKIDNSACDATWMSGLASIDLNELAIAAPKFTRAMTCFTSSAGDLRKDLARLRSAIDARGTPPSARERRNLERTERDANNAEEKSAQSAYNAAQCYARTGHKDLALKLIDAAIAYPTMKEKAQAMKAAIEKLPN